MTGDALSLGLMATGVVGNFAGAKVGQMLGKSLDGNSGKKQEDPVSKTVLSMNDILQQALNTAISQSTGYTNKAIDQQNTSLGAATGALNTYLNQGLAGAAAASKQGFNQGQALAAPYSNAGYGALDAYQDSLGLKRPTMGGQAYAQAGQTANNMMPMIQQLQQQAKTAGVGNAFGPLSAPTAPTMINTPYGKTKEQTQLDLEQYYLQNPQQMYQHHPGTYELAKYGANRGYTPQTIAKMSAEKAWEGVYNRDVQAHQAQLSAQNQAAQQQYNNQVSLFSPYQNTYTQLQQQLNSMSPQQQQQVMSVGSSLFGGR